MKLKILLKSTILALLLAFVPFASYGQFGTNDPSGWFYVTVDANVSWTDCGTNPGEIQLSYKDIYHNLVDVSTMGADARPVNPIVVEGDTPEEIADAQALYDLWEQECNLGIEHAENSVERDGNRITVTGQAYAQEYYDEGYYWYLYKDQQLNDYNPSEWGLGATMTGYSVFYMPGVDSVEISSSLFLSSYVYFFGKVRENDGWYFTGWSFTEGESDLGGSVDTNTPEDEGKLFKILPSEEVGMNYRTTQNLYATFQPVMVSNYKVNGLINKSVSNSTTVVFDVVGQRVSTEDFTVSVPEADFSAEITTCVDNKVTVTVTYSGTIDGEFRGNVTLASKSGCSQLTAPVYARVGVSGDVEATLYEGKTPTATSGTLLAMIAAADNTDQIVVLNKNIGAATSVNAYVTINFNGYNVANTFTVAGGEVTVAYSKYGGGANALSVTGGKAILNGGEFGVLSVGASGIVEQNGATFTAASNNGGILIATEGRFEAGLISSGTLTVNGGLFEGETAITVSGGTANINKATISGTEYGILTAGGTTNITSKLVSVFGATNAIKRNGGTVNLLNGKYSGATPLAGTINLQAGYFKVDGEHLGVALPEGKKVLNVLAGTEFAEGYRYFVGDDASSVGVCRIGTTAYTTLEDALAYANNNPDKDVVIVMTNDYTLPAGYYTLPPSATLIVPMNKEQETANEIIPRIASTSKTPRAYIPPYAYLTLTFAAGVNIDVHGIIEVSGTQRATDGSYAAHPHGPCGFINMEEGSRMTLQGGSELRAWGFIIGKGETDVRRDAYVREQFQMGDWKGGSTSFGMLSDYERRVFPLTHYYIQNIESPCKYHPGAVLSTTTAVSATYAGVTVTAAANDIKVIGVNGSDQAMFLMDNEADAENTWVRKWYDVEHDLQVYDVNNSAHIGSMVLDLGKLGTEPLQMNSGFFVLPITCNMKIHLLSGMMDFTQNTALLPGAEVEIDKESMVTVVKNPDPSVLSGSLYIYDVAQWDKYAYDEGGLKYTKAVQYAAGLGDRPTARADQFYDKSKMKSATINVHGSFAITEEDCYLLTSAGGANIISSNEDAGTFVFGVEGPSSSVSASVWQVKNRTEYTNYEFTPAQLKNKEGHIPAFTETADANANTSFCYMDDEWRNRHFFGCYAADVTSGFDAAVEAHSADVDFDYGSFVEHLYIKPQEWVEIAGTPHLKFADGEPEMEGVDGNSDHTYSDAAGAGRLFIQMDGCQWWEVEKKDNLYHCIHPENDTYYYWGVDPEDGEEKWLEKKYIITWRNWDGEIIQTTDAYGDPIDEYIVSYGTMAEFLGTNPTREADIDYTYDFTGWSPELAPVTSDVTYTATYEQKERKYTITFLQEGGVEIERQFLPHNAVPVCENAPAKVGHILTWTPAISPVIKDQDYTATWLEELPDRWNVTFVNNAGYVLQEGDVLTTDHPEYNGSAPKKENADHSEYSSNEYTCTFNGWSAVIDGVVQTFAPGAELPCPTAPTTYTAVYTQEDKTYLITFRDENGDEIESHEYKYGETPVCYDIPTKDNTAQYSYSFAWTPQIESVREAKTYTAVFTPVENMYTVTLRSNPSEACTFIGAGIYKYNADVAISQTPKDGYTFQKWTNATGEDVSELPTKVTEDINLVANFLFEGTGHEITWKNWNGNELARQTYKEGTATTYTGQTPTRPDKDGLTYAFDGWSTTLGGELAYKNNMTPKATGPATYFAHFVATEIPDLNVSGITTLTEPVTKRNLVITSNGSSSGQLLNPDYLTLTGKAYFDLTINANANTWYAFGLPWEVNVSGAISDGTRTLSYGNTCYLLEYNGDDRAAQTLDPETDSYWTYVKSGTLKPSKLYMIYLRYPATTLRFTKAAGAEIANTEIPISPYVCSADPAESGWNAIANPTTCYAKLASADIPSGKGQVYIPGRPNTDGTAGDRYDPITLADQQLIVGQPLFVQVDIAGDKTMTANGSNQFSAPKRDVKTSSEYEIRIAPAKADFTDRLYIKTSEEKEDRYVIGQDLSKISVAQGVAQMWINRYDHKLCFNTTEMVNNQAVFPMGISVPVDGHYAISTVTPAVDDEDIFVTVDGTPVWNLTQGAYSMDIKAGTTNEYGLLVVYHPTPEISTGCDQLESIDKPSVRKVLINGQVYILRDGAVYTIFGQKAK